MTSQPDDPPRPRRLVAPLAPAAQAMAAGIVADRFGPQVATTWWAVAGSVAALLVFLRPGGRAVRVAVVLAFAAVGGGWHHARWTDLAPDDLARGDWSTPRPAWLRGALLETPEFRPSEGADRDGSTRAVLDVAAIGDGRDWRPATGRVLVTVSGDRADLQAGQPVFAAGKLGAIPGPLNPGEADRRDRSRAEGMCLRMSVGEALSLWPDPQGRARPFARWLGGVRAESHRLLVSGLAPDVSALAAALLLGRRERVDPDVNDAFARTGTTHLLAISGLHLQALAVLLFVMFRVVGLGPKPAFVGVMLATIGYALLVGLMPSVVRAAAMTVMVCLAGLCDRCAMPANRLAAAALATMALNPAHLFDAGCQLSFLAVMALFWGVPALLPRKVPGDPDDRPTRASRLDALERRLEPRWKQQVRKRGRSAARGLLASVVVWLATLPLVALRFHVIAPIGVLLNLPLIPITSAALVFAGLTLLSSMIWPPLGRPAAWACGELLRLTDRVVAWGAAQPMGSMFTAGPSPAGAVAVYALLALAAWASFRRWRTRRILWGALGIESALVALLACWPGRPGAMEAEVLAVDHGLAVLVRGQDGSTLLYDCGKMRDPHVGRRIVAPALWARGVRRIDCVVLSHADSDHYNGLPDLLDRFAVGEVRVPPGFGGPSNPDAARLLALARSRGVPVRPIVAGDRIDLGGGDGARVLHPPAGWLPSAPDNARSVVLDVVGGKRSLLLTGDLEGPGLAELVSGPAPRPDAMLAPHHGARAANPEWLYRWAGAGRVVASQKRPSGSTRDPFAPLARLNLPVDRTWSRGAIALGFDRRGMVVRGFLDPSGPTDRSRWVAASALPLGRRASVAALGVLAGLGLCLALAVVEWGAWTLAMPGRRPRPPDVEPPPWTPIEATAGDGVTLRGAWLGPGDPSAGAIVLLHGFGEDRSGMRGRAEAMAERGWGVALLDSRGRGQSGGDRVAFGGFEADDLRAWLDVLAGRSPWLVAWGRSMGAAVAARTAADDLRIAALILEAPYADLRSAVAAWLQLARLPRVFAWPMLVRARRIAGASLHEPTPLAVAHRVAVPALILHGSADRVCPAEAVRKLAEAFAGAVEVLEVNGAGHVDVFEKGGQALADRIAAWACLRSPLPQKDPGTGAPHS